MFSLFTLIFWECGCLVKQLTMFKGSRLSYSKKVVCFKFDSLLILGSQMMKKLVIAEGVKSSWNFLYVLSWRIRKFVSPSNINSKMIFKYYGFCPKN